MNAEELIKWLLEKGLMRTRFDKFLNEQLVEITDLGKEINEILDKLRTDSEEAQATNESVAEAFEKGGL